MWKNNGFRVSSSTDFNAMETFACFFSLSLSHILFVSFIFVSVYLFDGIKCRPKWQKISMESLLEQQTWTNNDHQTNKRWNEIYEFFTAAAATVVWVCVWTLPLDGINNNKAKLRDSLITISRFHLTAVPLALKHSGHCVQAQRMSARTRSPVLERCEMCTIERCHLFRVAIKLCFMSLRLFSRLPCADHHYPPSHPCSHRLSFSSLRSFPTKLFGGKHNRKLQLFPQYFYVNAILIVFDSDRRTISSLLFRSLSLSSLYHLDALTNSFS